MANPTTYERHYLAIRAIATTSAIGLVVASAGFGAIFAYRIGIEHSMSLEDIGEKFALTRERVRQIKDKAINKLRSTSRSKLLKAYLGA